MRVGISIITRADQNIWENGLGQNVVFLARALASLPQVSSIVFIDVGSEKRMPADWAQHVPEVQVVTQEQATDLVDLVVEMAGALEVAWLDLIRARGVKVVFMCCGQPYVGLVEPTVFGRPVHASRPDRCDEIWLFEKDEAYTEMMRTLHRCPVRIVPYIWSSDFVGERIRQVRHHGLEYGFEAARAAGTLKSGLRLAIFEPNISVVKVSSVAMLACDEAFRADPEAVAFVQVLNALHMKDHLTMLHFANSLDFVKQHRASFEGRHDIVGFMSQFANAVVAHQWCNAQNYSYLDVLFGNYPLIHNSPWLKSHGAGYYYPEFDAAQAGRQILEAHRHHEAYVDDYSQKSQALFRKLDPLTDENLASYSTILSNLL